MMFLISLVAPEEGSEPDKGPDGYRSELRDLPVFFFTASTDIHVLLIRLRTLRTSDPHLMPMLHLLTEQPIAAVLLFAV